MMLVRRDADVVPAVDFSRLDEVSVVLVDQVAAAPGAPGSGP